MNTNLINNRSTVRATALAACLALLFAGATACGSENETAPANSGSRPHTLSSVDLIETAKSGQRAYLHQLRVEAEAARQRPVAHAPISADSAERQGARNSYAGTPDGWPWVTTESDHGTGRHTAGIRTATPKFPDLVP